MAIPVARQSQNCIRQLGIPSCRGPNLEIGTIPRCHTTAARCMEPLNCHPRGSSCYNKFVVVSVLSGVTRLALFSSLLDSSKFSSESISLSTVPHNFFFFFSWLVQVAVRGYTPSSYLHNTVDYKGWTQSSLGETTLDCHGKSLSFPPKSIECRIRRILGYEVKCGWEYKGLGGFSSFALVGVNMAISLVILFYFMLGVITLL